MTEKFIALLGAILLMIFAFAGGTVVVTGMTKWYQVQTETQFIANSMARYGGYTLVAEQSLQNFCNSAKFERSQMTVIVTPSNPPATYGKVVSVKIYYPFKQTISYMGRMSNVFDFPIATYACGISMYMSSLNPGAPVQAAYISPS